MILDESGKFMQIWFKESLSSVQKLSCERLNKSDLRESRGIIV